MQLDSALTILQAHIPLFIKEKNKVLHQWVKEDIIQSILTLHKIDSTKFISYYASGVFDYFLSVIKRETALGSCPVMEEFLAYLKNKNFHADELYILCTHFKKSMIDTSYTKDINSQEVFQAISFLFDANFSGVLRLYTDTIYQKEQIIAKSLNLLNEYKHAIDTSAIVSKTDVEGIITYASANFCELSGYTAKELIGNSHNIVRHPDTSESFYQQMWASIRSNHIFKGTIKNVKKSGEDYYVDITILPLTDPMQGIVEYISIAYDVSTLVMAKEEAYEASQAKENFLSAMSHEIRTPLNAILGFVDILKEDAKEELALHYLNIISHSGSHLLHLINDVLDYSKLQNSQITPSYERFNAHETFHTLFELFAQLAKDHQLHFSSNIQSELPQYIKADEMRIQQIISNLLGNAIKFTPKGGDVKIAIEVHHQNLLIRVEDNGIGISDELQADIFKPFIQAKQGQKGTGLGLAITRELIQAMKGSITLKSKADTGTCFSVSLPFEASTQDEHLFIPSKLFKKEFNAHILVAEDNHDNQELLGLLLKRFGLSFELVSNGEDAFDIFKARSFDMIILDDEMPLMKGHQVAKHIRLYEAEHERPKTPIILLSANATIEVQTQAIEHGCNQFLSKPIEIEKLQKIFESYFPHTFNHKNLAKELSLDLDDLSFLLDIFTKNLPKYMKNLQEAINQKSYTDINKASHKIKGSASNFNFVDIMQILKDLDQSIQQKEEATFQTHFNQLSHSFSKLGLL